MPQDSNSRVLPNPEKISAVAEITEQFNSSSAAVITEYRGLSVKRIADLESREVLLAKLAGALKALPTRAAGLFQAPLSQMVRLAKALEEKKPAAAAAEAPAAEAAADEAPAADAPTAEATETPAE